MHGCLTFYLQLLKWMEWTSRRREKKDEKKRDIADIFRVVTSCPTRDPHEFIYQSKVQNVRSVLHPLVRHSQYEMYLSWAWKLSSQTLDTFFWVKKKTLQKTSKKKRERERWQGALSPALIRFVKKAPFCQAVRNSWSNATRSVPTRPDALIHSLLCCTILETWERVSIAT